MKKYSKEGIMVNQNLRKLIKIHIQEDHLLLDKSVGADTNRSP
jgi:hypothetical protein